jgi:hypothetical protein
MYQQDENHSYPQWMYPFIHNILRVYGKHQMRVRTMSALVPLTLDMGFVCEWGTVMNDREPLWYLL